MATTDQQQKSGPVPQHKSVAMGGTPNKVPNTPPPISNPQKF